MKKYLTALICFIGTFAFSSQDYFERVDEAETFLRETVKATPKLLIVLTAGIEGPIDLLEEKVEISSSEIPYFPVARAAGHAGKLIFGKLDGVEIVLMKGRYHFYEGMTAQDVVFPYFVLNKMGVESVITMNATGGIRKDLDVGDIMIVSDHINFLSDNPLKGLAIQFPEKQFTSMINCYDPWFQEVAKSKSYLLGSKVKEGVYLAVSGPNYETKAEIQAFRSMGADFVGMSTIFEVIACRFLDMRVLAFSCITNPAADRHVGKMTHEEVLNALNDMNPKLSELVNACAKEIVSTCH